VVTFDHDINAVEGGGLLLIRLPQQTVGSRRRRIAPRKWAPWSDTGVVGVVR